MMQFASVIPQKWVCLHCRVVFKPLRSEYLRPDEAERHCGRCQNRLWFAGKAFRAPRRNDVKAWRTVAELLRSGFVFHQNHALFAPPSNPNALNDWRQRTQAARQQRRRERVRENNERQWTQQKRAAAWHAEGKRRRQEAHDSEN